MSRAPLPSATRRGITLMEVLISIGILAVGLTSVVALVPAGKSQAARSVTLDRSASMATNALADAITAGFTRFDSLTPISEDLNGDNVFQPNEDVNGDQSLQLYPLVSEDLNGDGQSTGIEDRDGNGAANTGFGFVVCDPLGAPYTETFVIGGNAKTLAALHVGIKATGVLATSGSLRWAGPGPADLRMGLLTQGRDDVLVNVDGVGADDPPLNRLSDGTRSFQGRMTCMLALARVDTGLYTASTVPVSPPLLAGELAKLSVVVFHGRTGVASEALLDANYNAAAGTLTLTSPLGDRTLKEILKPGVVVYDGKKVHAANFYNNAGGQVTGAQHERFSQITMASIDTTSSTVYVTFSGRPPSNGLVQILVDSVGLAEQTVVLEGPGAYGR
jgi:type II secretory pathway pseudopilin PulG